MNDAEEINGEEPSIVTEPVEPKVAVTKQQLEAFQRLEVELQNLELESPNLELESPNLELESPKAKKPRSEKQIAAFEKARIALADRRRLIKLEKEQGLIIAKKTKVKSKKKEKLTASLIDAGISTVSEERVVEIIKSEKLKRKDNKTKINSEKQQKIKEARELLGIVNSPVKPRVKRQPRVKKLTIVEDHDENRHEIEKIKQSYQQPKRMLEPEQFQEAYDYQKGW